MLEFQSQLCSLTQRVGLFHRQADAADAPGLEGSFLLHEGDQEAEHPDGNHGRYDQQDVTQRGGRQGSRGPAWFGLQ